MTEPKGAEEHARVREAYQRRAVVDTRYSWLNPAHLAMYQGAEAAILSALGHEGIEPASAGLLEVGCGHGHWMRQATSWGMSPERVTGVDLLGERLVAGRRRAAPGTHWIRGSGIALPFPSGSFEVVLASTVFSSILSPELRDRVAAEMLRVCNQRGVVLVYDFRYDNPANRDVRAVTRRDIGRHFRGSRVRVQTLTLLPPLARRVTPVSTMVARILEMIPPLRGFILASVRP